jgi:hypothetical protein
MRGCFLTCFPRREISRLGKQSVTVTAPLHEECSSCDVEAGEFVVLPQEPGM